MNDNETVDDVLADMLLPRFDAITAMRANNYDEIKSLVANYRDRLEAALKRERGDCAKLREALERVLCWLKRMNAQPLNTLAISELTPSYAVSRTAKSIIEDNDYHISQLTAALAATKKEGGNDEQK